MLDQPHDGMVVTGRGLRPKPVLRIEDLSVGYDGGQLVRAVRHVDLTVHEGEIVGLVGESGCGKSTLMAGALRTLPPPGVVLGGRVRLGQTDLLTADAETLRALRWTEVAVVPQSAMASLNPVLSVADHFADTLAAHGVTDAAQRRAHTERGLAMVGIEARHADAYPHELSGGMRQRVTIALALALRPRLVVFDEPTTALDVVLERSILRQVLQLRDQLNFGAVFITHDLALLLQFADRVAVLYAGRLAECAPAVELRKGPRHPYARGLLAALPRLDGDPAAVRGIPGRAPRPEELGVGCAFAARCDRVQDRCREQEPPVIHLGPGHEVACWEASA